MGNDILKYKEFWTKINYSIEDNLFYGKNQQEIKQSFEIAVNDYIQFCKELNKNITFKNVKI